MKSHPNEDVIGSQIRELRKVKGMTLQQVADAAGISVGYLSQIERNQSKLPIGILKKNQHNARRPDQLVFSRK